MEDEIIQPSETFVAVGTIVSWGSVLDPGSLFVQTTYENQMIPVTRSQNIMFHAKDHTVTINLETGSVDLGGADLDDAALAFWDAVQRIAGRR